MSRDKANGKFRNRTDEILFIDARNMGHLINRRTREFAAEDITAIAGTYHKWRAVQGSTNATGDRTSGVVNPDGDYEDVKGFCKSTPIERVRDLDYLLRLRGYVDLPETEGDFDFKERFTSLKAEFEEQLKEEARLNALIADNLGKVKLS